MRRRRRKAERDGDGPRVPWRTVSFLLISGATSHHTAQLTADNYLAGCREGSRKTRCPWGLQNLPILELIWERQPKKPNTYIYFNRAISASQAG